jgi:hypothetical protein
MKDINNYLAKGFSHICLSSTKALFLSSHEGNKKIRELAGKNENILLVMELFAMFGKFRTSVGRNIKKILPHNKTKNTVLRGRNQWLLKNSP